MIRLCRNRRQAAALAHQDGNVRTFAEFRMNADAMLGGVARRGHRRHEVMVAVPNSTLRDRSDTDAGVNNGVTGEVRITVATDSGHEGRLIL